MKKKVKLPCVGCGGRRRVIEVLCDCRSTTFACRKCLEDEQKPLSCGYCKTLNCRDTSTWEPFSPPKIGALRGERHAHNNLDILESTVDRFRRALGTLGFLEQPAGACGTVRFQRFDKGTTFTSWSGDLVTTFNKRMRFPVIDIIDTNKKVLKSHQIRHMSIVLVNDGDEVRKNTILFRRYSGSEQLNKVGLENLEFFDRILDLEGQVRALGASVRELQELLHEKGISK